ncbi:MAG: polysaccharide deacetylase family protein [Clostridia bacterium]|nr:polysaccharide deacetylase family protein [Clostridia bacterium]
MFVIRMRTVLLYLFLLAVIMMTAQYAGGGQELPVSGKVGGKELPILMYHGICEKDSDASKFVISVRMLKDDLKYLKENGYQTVTVKDVIAYVKGEEDLPEKPVMLTFDDGNYNNYYYGFPLLKEYEMKAVISIIGKYTDLFTQKPDENPTYSNLNWAQVKEMMDSGLVEFQNHSYNLHENKGARNGAKKRLGESDEAYEKVLREDLGLLQQEMQEHTGYTPTTFVYPFGGISQASVKILKDMGFQVTLSCEEKNNYLTVGDTECLTMMNRFLRSDQASARAILEKL